jgi:excisionase family DNA binding protein
METTIKKKRYDPKKRVLDQYEAALYMGCTFRTVGDLYRAGQLAGSKPTGKKIYFDKEMLDQFLLSRMNKTASELESEAALHVHKNH